VLQQANGVIATVALEADDPNMPPPEAPAPAAAPVPAEAPALDAAPVASQTDAAPKD
jgi:hypothetical protein